MLVRTRGRTPRRAPVWLLAVLTTAKISSGVMRPARRPDRPAVPSRQYRGGQQLPGCARGRARDRHGLECRRGLRWRYAVPTVKRYLSAIRELFDWVVEGHVMETNPALSVKSPRYSVGKGLTPVLGNEETPALSTASTLPRSSGCAIRAMIAFLTYTFARVSAAINVTVGDLYPRGRRWRVRCGRRTGSWSTSPATTTSSTDQEFAERLYSDLQAKGVCDAGLRHTMCLPYRQGFRTRDPRVPSFGTSAGGEITTRIERAFEQQLRDLKAEAQKAVMPADT